MKDDDKIGWFTFLLMFYTGWLFVLTNSPEKAFLFISIGGFVASLLGCFNCEVEREWEK